MRLKFKKIESLLALTLGYLSFSSFQASAATFPFRTEGRSIVDANGQTQHLKAVNWYGANLESQVARGLEVKTADEIAATIRELGYNSVRLTFSNAMIHDKNPVSPDSIRANPGFMGMTPLEVFDRTVEALARQDIAIMLNDHSTNSVWCCSYDTDGLWHFSGNSGKKQTEEQWIDDWKMMVERYKHIPQVMGADLRNEVRTAKWGDSILPLSPNWGSGDGNDWARAAERAGNAVLDVNKNILVIVEGINWTGTLSMFGGYRPHLTPVAGRPIQLKVPGRLVYAAHNYGYIGPKHNGDGKTSPGQITYKEMDEETLFKHFDSEFGYIVEPSRHYTAPVMISEFGVSYDTNDDKDRRWFRSLVKYIEQKKLHFAYWPLNPEGYGIVGSDWKARSNDWRAESFQKLVGMTPEEKDTRARFHSVNIQQGTQNLTSRFDDWQVGANKGTCADDTRLIGLSKDHRALCTNQARNSQWSGEVFAVTDYERAPTDWAGGHTKYTCDADSFVIGYSKRYWGTSGVLCMKAKASLSNSCRTVWFDRGDNRATEDGGDFARGSYKGQCAPHEFVNGIAQKNGQAAALRCCSY